MDLSRFPDDFEHVPSHDTGGPDSELNDILKRIDAIFGPEQPHDHLDISGSDGRTTPIVSPISRPGSMLQLRAPLHSLSAAPPRIKKSSAGKVWNKFKVFAKKFAGGDKPPPKLSNKLVPERDDEVRRHETLFTKALKPSNPAKPLQPQTSSPLVPPTPDSTSSAS